MAKLPDKIYVDGYPDPQNPAYAYPSGSGTEYVRGDIAHGMEKALAQSRDYIWHRGDCAYINEGEGFSCDCGFFEALRQVQDAMAYKTSEPAPKRISDKRISELEARLRKAVEFHEAAWYLLDALYGADRGQPLPVEGLPQEARDYADALLGFGGSLADFRTYLVTVLDKGNDDGTA